MTSLCRRILPGVFSFLIAAATVLAQTSDIPLHNWTVPPYRSSGATGGLRTMADVTPGIGFVGIQPCRVVDTRGNGAPIQGGILPNSGLRNWDVTGICGIPAGADALSVNFTVVSAAATPQGAFLLAWPTGQAPPPTAIMTYGPGVTILSNAAVVPMGPGETLTVNVSHSTHIIMDVNGYFSDTLNTGNQFVIVASVPDQGALRVENTAVAATATAVLGTASATTGITWGVLGVTNSNTGGAAGVRGVALRTSGFTLGVSGVTLSTTSGAAGVLGEATAASGTTYGVYGITSSESANAAGVRGRDGGGSVTAVTGGNLAAGVRGEAVGGVGVVGLSIAGLGVAGYNLDGDGFIRAHGFLGFDDNIGLYVVGDSSVSGTKSFVEPHPTDASKVIRYISLEGNESGTYFRGRGRFQNGLAVIEVPEDFRIVTDPEGLTVQITPIGGLATVGVLKMDLNRIVVQSSRNLEFSYMVNGIRHAYRDAGPIAENERLFVPMSPDERMSRYLPEVFKQRLISNGTYRADGTVNMETARRLGWDKEWEKRNPPAPAPAPE